MKRLRVAVIGAGMAFGPHARALLDLQDRIDVACVVSRSPARRDDIRARYGFVTAPSLDDVTRDPGIEAVIVLTPPASHLEITRALASCGKHILLEKPLSVSVPAAREIVDLCARQQVLLGTVLQHRFRASARELRQLLDEGRLGRIEGIFISIPWWRPQTYYDEPGRGTFARDGGGVLVTQGIHTIDLALSLAGPVAEVFAYAATSRVHKMETEDMVVASLRFESGALGSLSASTACYPGFSEQIRIVGTNGSATLEGEALQVSFMDGTFHASGTPGVLGGGADPMAFSRASHRALIAQFAEAVRARRDPVPGGREALDVQLLIDGLLRSARERTVVAVEHAGSG